MRKVKERQLVNRKNGKKHMTKKALMYVIQKHKATHLHYDLRLEKNGVLKSWAVPKRPPLKKNVKRLAIQTENHALDHTTYEGVTLEGSREDVVKLWDTGTYLIEKQRQGFLLFQVRGKKLKGRYCLLRLKNQKKNWLFFKC